VVGIVVDVVDVVVVVDDGGVDPRPCPVGAVVVVIVEVVGAGFGPVMVVVDVVGAVVGVVAWGPGDGRDGREPG
jgi:hypothetical protein